MPSKYAGHDCRNHYFNYILSLDHVQPSVKVYIVGEKHAQPKVEHGPWSRNICHFCTLSRYSPTPRTRIREKYYLCQEDICLLHNSRNLHTLFFQFSFFYNRCSSINGYCGGINLLTHSSYDDCDNTCTYYLIIIIKLEIWPICHCSGLGHETMSCAVCLYILIRMTYFPHSHARYISTCKFARFLRTQFTK